jgi:hypothetical protein
MLAFVSSTSAGNVNAYTFKLANDIDMSSVGTGTPYVPYFGATDFKGNGKAVNNFSFNRQTSGIGFLGYVHKSTLTDLQVNTVSYSGQTVNAINALEYVGAAAGSVYGSTVTGGRVTNTARVIGQNYIGGFAGYFGYGTASNNMVTNSAAVNGTSYVAGFGGAMNYSTVSGSLATLGGLVSGTSYVGGFAGTMNQSVIYSTQSLRASATTGSADDRRERARSRGLVNVGRGSHRAGRGVLVILLVFNTGRSQGLLFGGPTRNSRAGRLCRLSGGILGCAG